MKNIYELNDVSFCHHPGTPMTLDHMDMKIPEGSRSTVIGANGAGKTTLFNTMTGVYKPVEGEVLFDGEPIEYTRDGLTHVRSQVSVVLQNPDEQIFCSLVEEDVAFGPLNLGIDRDEVERRIEKSLRDVRMSEYRRRPLQQLSGGQKKRVAIAGALAVNPRVMIMDEPTAGLDPQSAMEVMELAEKLNLQGTTVIISTHDLNLAYSWADTVNVIRHGRNVYSGLSDDFYSDIEEVYLCGLLPPSTFNINREISLIRGTSPSPYPRNVSSALAKFGNSEIVPGRIFCVQYDGSEINDHYEKAVNEAGRMSLIGVYGSDSRYALSGKKIDFYFNGIDSCFTEAVCGRDTVLIYDKVYEPLVRGQASVLAGFGMKIDLEMIS